MPIKEKIWPVPPLIFGGALILLGALGLLKCPDDLGRRLGEAMFISGVLALTVDLYLKRKLQVDAARDIFGHLLGMSFPPQLRDRLQAFVFETKTYRINSIIDIQLEMADEAVELTIEGTSTVVAVSDTVYEPHLWFEESVKGRLLRVSVTSTSKPDLSYSMTDVPLKASSEQMVWEWKGRKVSMQRGEELTTYAKYVVRRAREDYLMMVFGTPHINPRLRISGDTNLNFSVSAADQINGNEYLYRRVFLKGDHLAIRWAQKTGAQMLARAASVGS